MRIRDPELLARMRSRPGRICKTKPLALWQAFGEVRDIENPFQPADQRFFRADVHEHGFGL